MIFKVNFCNNAEYEDIRLNETFFINANNAIDAVGLAEQYFREKNKNVILGQAVLKNISANVVQGVII